MREEDEGIIAAIDGDSIAYLCSKDTIDESITNVDNIMADILRTTGASKYYLFLSEGKYFRHEFYRDYKANRPPTKLKYVRTLLRYLKEQYLAISVPRVEADDMVMHIKSNFSNVVICAMDKDVLKGIEGRHYNYKTLEFVETTAMGASYNLWLQTLMGDSGDNIKGIPGVGEVGAKKILDSAERPFTDKKLSKVTLEAYINKFGASTGVYEFQKNFRLVYMLRHDQDFLNEINRLPIFGSPVLVNSNTEQEW